MNRDGCPWGLEVTMSKPVRISSSGQVTIPKEIRDIMGVKPGDVVTFRVLEGGRVTVEPPPLTFDQLIGFFGQRPQGLPIEQLIEEGKEAYRAHINKEYGAES